MKSLSDELRYTLHHIQQRRKDGHTPIISRRQKRKLKWWAKKRWLELTALAWFILAIIVESAWWLPLFIASWGMVIGLWRWRKRDIEKGDAEVERYLKEKAPAGGDAPTSTKPQKGKES